MQISGKHLVLIALTGFALAGCGGDEPLDSPNGSQNTPPIISGSPATTLSAGSAYSFTPTAADPDGDTLTYAISNRPAWAQFNTSTGALTGTPSEADVGMSQMITIEVSDSRAIAQLPGFRIQVASSATPPPPVNVAPTISGTPATTATVGQTYTFAPVGADSNGDTLSYSIQNRPAWLTFTPATGRLTGTPNAAGSFNAITITVSDGTLTATLPAFNITVAATPPTNRAPTITGSPATSAQVGTAYNFQPVGSDPDGNTLTYSIQNRPSWATFSTTTGRLTGTPAAGNVGSFSNITITVTDGTASTSLAPFAIQVAAQANRPPTISGSPLTSVLALVGYAFQPSASDPDGNTLTFSIQNRPAWATFSTTTGRLSGTPSILDIATYNNIVITVSDGTASASLPGFSLSVLQSANGTATVNWSAPTTNTDGSALTDLAGFRIAYGQSQTNLDQSASITNASLTTYTVNNLSQGTWYFAVYAVNSSGLESDISNVGSKTIN
jgi:predicted small lipoprotein YifL